MAKKMNVMAVSSLVLTVALSVLYAVTSYGVLLSLSITFGTLSYHLIMRLLVGLGFQIFMKNNADITGRWYKVSKSEMSVYERLKVKKWKNKMPTYYNMRFDPRKYTWNEIAQTMCQSELVHETIVVLSFLPIAAGNWFGAYPVFIITSVLSAAFDMMFVIMQRYNRQRIKQLLIRKGELAEIQKQIKYSRP